MPEPVFRSHATWIPPTDERETIQLNVSTPGSSDLGTSFNTDEITLSNSELSSQAQALQELEEINKSPYAQPRRKKNGLIRFLSFIDIILSRIQTLS